MRQRGSVTSFGWICGSVEKANAYLMESFRQMFPEHVCSEQCRGELD